MVCGDVVRYKEWCMHAMRGGWVSTERGPQETCRQYRCPLSIPPLTSALADPARHSHKLGTTEGCLYTSLISCVAFNRSRYSPTVSVTAELPYTRQEASPVV